jgi:hypothetical protein
LHSLPPVGIRLGIFLFLRRDMTSGESRRGRRLIPAMKHARKKERDLRLKFEKWPVKLWAYILYSL